MRARTARIAVVGLGYAGLPMAVELAGAGFPIVGFDVDSAKVDTINLGRSPVSNVGDAEVQALRETERLHATTDPSELGWCRRSDHLRADAADARRRT